MISPLKRLSAGACLAAILAAALTVQAVGPQAPTLKIVEPGDGASVTGGDVALLLEATGVQIGSRGRNGAHVLLFLDELPAMKSYAERFTFRGVAAGPHRLRAELRRPDGAAFDPPVVAQVEFRVTDSTRDAGR